MMMMMMMMMIHFANTITLINIRLQYRRIIVLVHTHALVVLINQPREECILQWIAIYIYCIPGVPMIISINRPLLQDGSAGKKHLDPTINQFFCHVFWLWRGVTGFGFYTIQYNAIQIQFFCHWFCVVAWRKRVRIFQYFCATSTCFNLQLRWDIHSQDVLLFHPSHIKLFNKL